MDLRNPPPRLPSEIQYWAGVNACRKVHWVLTGVRSETTRNVPEYLETHSNSIFQGMSLRLLKLSYADQSASSPFSNLLHYLFLLLGQRPSIASQLRKILPSPGPPPTPAKFSHYFNHPKASSCHLTFCTPSSVLVLEKDLKFATTYTSNQFLAMTNHDVVKEAWSHQQWRYLVQVGTSQAVNAARELVEESMEPKECICDLWRSQGSDDVSIEDVKSWLRRYPMKNECTHFSCIMGPLAQGGGFRGTMGIVIRTSPHPHRPAMLSPLPPSSAGGSSTTSYVNPTTSTTARAESSMSRDRTIQAHHPGAPSADFFDESKDDERGASGACDDDDDEEEEPTSSVSAAAFAAGPDEYRISEVPSSICG